MLDTRNHRHHPRPWSVTADDAGHLLQSPAAQGMARSLSEIVLQLFSDDQLSGDCARALSLQLGSSDVADLQQLQGAAACSYSRCCMGSAAEIQTMWLMARLLKDSPGIGHSQSACHTLQWASRLGIHKCFAALWLCHC